MTQKIETFTSRFGLIAAAMGMAIGAGNIWRFPRLVGQYGGSFLIPWFLFLFIWSIPLLIVEFSIGKKTRMGTIGSFSKAIGPNYAWMGWFVGFCSTAILFYYAVVCGWSLKYFTLSFTGQITTVNHQIYWQDYSSSIFQPIVYHFLSVFIGCYIIYRGIVHGVERFSKIIIPLLFLLLIFAAFKALTLQGSEIGLNYYFTVHFSALSNYKIWLEALSQSAWSTGAGWGLYLTYAIYSRQQEKIMANSFFTGLGDNAASILAGLAIIPTVFALSQNTEVAYQALDSGNQGLAFIIIPQLFMKMSGGHFFTTIFFLALFIATITSLISMIELAVRILMDFGFKRKVAVVIIALGTFLLGIPSAISLNIFNNQDWVWGLGLLLSGAFFNFAVLKIGVTRFLEEWLVRTSQRRLVIYLSRVLFYVIIPVEFMVMLGWWLTKSIQWNPNGWWNPLATYGLVSTLLQWLIIIGLGFLFNKKFNQWLEVKNQ